MNQPHPVRSAFFVSDSTAITAETLGHSLLSQFKGIKFRQTRIPFVNNEEKALAAAARIAQAAREDNARPIVFTTLVEPALNAILDDSQGFCVPLLETFLAPLENELRIESTHTIGGSHSFTENKHYEDRLDAINFALNHDDGITMAGMEQANVILVGVSRCGKTPTSIYLAMQFGIKAANYPLIPEDFERGRLPQGLDRFRQRMFGLTIQPERLHKIRSERRPNSHYASIENCRREVAEAERLMQREGIRWLDSTTKSIEEISTTIMHEIKLEGHAF
ncbi:pyruvate, water dikinase regulatory protein [Rhodocyclus purpureus]|uniref:posphoenolpyruvate synthetase regulatory kinase/phosphorylase PpsR n=1 Tax=Rhodocyclus purpureus TaxID=1067 RepID=UPI001914090B|nr:pyruvate, water dikinase regulatory protein [Rhodocyclus purpureus]MBK5915705.1 phosphoenolpyruvate synthase regulatory protein [Rhodocyclus purpureus]